MKKLMFILLIIFVKTLYCQNQKIKIDGLKDGVTLTPSKENSPKKIIEDAISQGKFEYCSCGDSRRITSLKDNFKEYIYSKDESTLIESFLKSNLNVYIALVKRKKFSNVFSYLNKNKFKFSYGMLTCDEESERGRTFGEYDKSKYSDFYLFYFLEPKEEDFIDKCTQENLNYKEIQKIISRKREEETINYRKQRDLEIANEEVRKKQELIRQENERINEKFNEIFNSGGINYLKTMANNYKYEGETSNGVYNGYGVFTININFNSWAYKYRFTGNFVNGEMQGIGKMEKILLNKVDFNGPSTRDMEYTFEGNFVNSFILGEGKLRTYLGIEGISANNNEDFPINSKGQYLLSGIFKSKLDFTIPVIINNEYILEYGLKLGEKVFIPKSLYKVITYEKSNLAKELGWRKDYKFVFVANLNHDKENYESYYTQLKNSGEIKELSFFQALGAVLGSGSNSSASKSSNNYEVLEQTNINRFEFTTEEPSEGELPSLHLSIGCNDYKHQLDIENSGFNVSFSTNGKISFKTSIDLSSYEREIRGENFWKKDGAIVNISFYSDDNVFTNLKLKFKKGGNYRIEIYPKQ